MTCDDVATSWTSPHVPPSDNSRADVVTGRNPGMEVPSKSGQARGRCWYTASCRSLPGAARLGFLAGRYCYVPPARGLAHPDGPAASNTGMDATVLEVSPG